MIARPVIVAGDRTHYLHTADDYVPGFEQHSILLACRTQVALYRWHAGACRAPHAALRVENGPLAAYLNISAEQLRTMAYAMLQCASDMDATAAQAPAQEAA